MPYIIGVVLLLISIFLPGLVMGAETGIVPACGEGNVFGPHCDFCDLLQLANNLIQFSIQLAVAVSVLMFAYAGFLYVTASANPKNLEQAKKIFGNVFLGFVLILLAWLIIDLVLVTFTGKDFAERTLGCRSTTSQSLGTSNNELAVVDSQNTFVPDFIPGLEKFLGSTNQQCNGSGAQNENLLPIGYMDNLNESNFEEGINFLSEEASGARNERAFAYVRMSDGSSEWVFMGNGGQTHVVLQWNNLESLIQKNRWDVQNIQIIHTHPSLPQCYRSPPSVQDIQGVEIIRTDDFANIFPLISNSELSFVAVESAGYWTYNPPPNWVEQQYGSQLGIVENLQEDFWNIPQVQEAFSNADECADPRIIQTQLATQALNGELGNEARRTLQRLNRAIASTNYVEILQAQQQLISSRYSSVSDCYSLDHEPVDNYIRLLEESGANIEYIPLDGD